MHQTFISFAIKMPLAYRSNIFDKNSHWGQWNWWHFIGVFLKFIYCLTNLIPIPNSQGTLLLTGMNLSSSMDDILRRLENVGSNYSSLCIAARTFPRLPWMYKTPFQCKDSIFRSRDSHIRIRRSWDRFTSDFYLAVVGIPILIRFLC